MAVFGCSLEPIGGLLRIFVQSLSAEIHHCQIGLCAGQIHLCGFTVPIGRFRKILCDAGAEPIKMAEITLCRRIAVLSQGLPSFEGYRVVTSIIGSDTGGEIRSRRRDEQTHGRYRHAHNMSLHETRAPNFGATRRVTGRQITLPPAQRQAATTKTLGRFV